MENNNTTAPLWKQLNEKRTQGEWWVNTIELTEGVCHHIDTKYSNDYSPFPAIVEAYKYQSLEEAESNAQYIALCVSNFANVVEALEALIKANRNGEAQGANWINAANALKKIS